MNKSREKVNAAIVVIGNEILSGRTQDVNVVAISKWLNELGVKLEEVRVVPDVEKSIIKTINEDVMTYIAGRHKPNQRLFISIVRFFSSDCIFAIKKLSISTLSLFNIISFILLFASLVIFPKILLLPVIRKVLTMLP